MQKRAVIIIIGCCLAANCLGCRHKPRHGLILRGDWSLECNRTPWLKGTNVTSQETSGSIQGCGSGCENGCESYPTEMPMSPDAEQLGYATPSDAGPCGQCGSSLPANLACRRCGHHEKAAEIGYHNHPRFHPVPTRPVFSPRTDESMAAGGQVMPIAAPPQIKLAPPIPVPEEIRAPRPQPLPTADRVTSSAGRASAVSRPFSWIFTPPTGANQSATGVASQPNPRWIRR